MPEDAARRAIKAALGDPEAKLALALDIQAMAMFDWNLETGKIHWPAGAHRLFGLEEGAIADWSSWSQHVLPEDEAIVAAVVQQAEQEHAPIFRFRYRLDTGSEIRSIEGSAQCIYNEQRKLIRVIGVNIDITERDRREQHLRAREAQLKSILDTVPDAMIAIDEYGVILQFSRAAEEMLGYRDSEVIGNNISMLTPPDIAPRHDSFIRHYLDTGEKKIIGRRRLLSARHRDGTLIPIELSVGEAFIGSERIFTGFIRDMSDRLRIERKSSELLNMLSQMDRDAAMSQLAAGLAHEINQPLTASANYLKAADLLMKRMETTSQVQDLVQLAVDQILRAGSIIRNLRQFLSRHEADVSFEPIEATVREAANLVLVGDARLSINLRFSFDQVQDSMIADRVQIQQVVINLVRNACEAERATGVSKSVLVSARSVEDNHVEISVHDNGLGIEAEQISKLFSTTATTKGSDNLGLGLAICRQIVAAHGGSIQATNAPTGGAIFSFTVPCGPDPKATSDLP